MLFGFGLIEELFKNLDVIEIYVMGMRIYYIENGLRLEWLEVYLSEEEIMRVIECIVVIVW